MSPSSGDRAVSTSETRDSAHELKFLVDTRTAGRIREWARARLSADPYGSGPFNDEYTTASVYLDTDARDVFHRRGSYGRSKYRIRRYAAADVVFLERKLRVATLLNKRRTTMPLAALMDLTGDLAFASPANPVNLANPENPANPVNLVNLVNPAGAAWFVRRILARRLRPATQVTYRRTARVGQAAWGTIRLTLDDHLAALPSTAFAFQRDAGTPVLDGRTILELKFRLEMPAVFKHLVEEFALEPAAISKYRLSATRLGLAGTEPASVRVREKRFA